jgi:HEAT repeat protein
MSGKDLRGGGGSMSTAELERESTETLARLMRRPLTPEELDAFDHHDVAWILSKRGLEGLEILVGQLGARDEAILRAAIFGVTASPGGAVVYYERIVELCDDERPGVVTEAVYGFAHARVRHARAKIDELSKHPAGSVRGAVIHYVARTDPRRGYARALEAIRDPEPIVRECAADALDDLGRPEAIPALKALVDDSTSSVRQAARTAIENLSRLRGR